MITKEEFLKLKEKLDQIAKLPYSGIGKQFEGIYLDNSGLEYRTSTWYSGCGTDEFTFFVDYEDIDKPLEYFENVFKEQHEAELKRKEEAKINEEKINLDFQYKQYEILKKKFDK